MDGMKIRPGQEFQIVLTFKIYAILKYLGEETDVSDHPAQNKPELHFKRSSPRV